MIYSDLPYLRGKKRNNGRIRPPKIQPPQDREPFRFLDLNKNGKLDVYEDPRQPLDARVEDLLSQMTVDLPYDSKNPLYPFGFSLTRK
jgi:beta-glucosidase